MCSVLAHELRSPLSVLQGYIRLLQRQRTADHPDMVMLEAMLDATGRLTSIARQASDLGNWLTTAESRPWAPIALTQITDVLTERLRTADPAIALLPVPAGAAATQLCADAAAVADALLAVAESAHRDDESATIEIRVTAPPEHPAAAFSLTPVASTHGARTFRSASAPRRRVAFDRGGAGLALIAASYVFDVHGASVVENASTDGIVIQFPQSGSAQ
jgi:light-regulated signal transduction histidine kinase (bacteriophytochrome)